MTSEDQEQNHEDESAAQQESPAPHLGSKPKDIIPTELDSRLENIKKVHADLEDLKKKVGEE
ncbi:hypothetical protein [Kitasatospora sp. NPDC056731]|uniref:hypothetical protein n=1 Tax=Kitasatospora sp. NPDC056731 TaxID=3155422 RepID=UPI00341EF143